MVIVTRRGFCTLCLIFIVTCMAPALYPIYVESVPIWPTLYGQYCIHIAHYRVLIRNRTSKKKYYLFGHGIVQRCPGQHRDYREQQGQYFPMLALQIHIATQTIASYTAETASGVASSLLALSLGLSTRVWIVQNRCPTAWKWCEP